MIHDCAVLDCEVDAGAPVGDRLKARAEEGLHLDDKGDKEEILDYFKTPITKA